MSLRISLNQFIKKIKDFVSENKAETAILFLILAVGAFCRLYKIDQYMTFLGDEGRDVIVVRKLLTQGHPPLIGPGTSIGNMYLGPLYYYIMAPALLLAGFSPVGPAVQIAILGVVTIWFVWYAGRIWFGKTAGLIAALLYGLSPTIIIYSRSSWNPNIMPFFALLSIYSVWKVWREHKFNWLLILGISFAAVLQSHYLGLLLAPTLGLFWLLTFVKVKKERKEFIKKTILGFTAFILLMSPLFFFDLRHDWINTRSIYTFLTVRQATVSIRPWTAVPKIPEIFDQINMSLVGGKNLIGGEIASVIIAAFLVILVGISIVKKSTGRIIPPMWVLTSWIGFALVGFGLYKQNIYDHYYGFVFPIPFLLIGVIVSFLFQYKLVGKIFGSALVVYLVIVNLMQNPLRFQPNRQMGRAINVANKIETESKGQRFNLGVIAERNYEDGYKYFLLKDNAPVISIDSQDKNSITDQLFAVCELPKEKCDPTHNATAAIANFGWSKIDAQWEVDGAIIYKLVHTN